MSDEESVVQWERLRAALDSKYKLDAPLLVKFDSRAGTSVGEASAQFWVSGPSSKGIFADSVQNWEMDFCEVCDHDFIPVEFAGNDLDELSSLLVVSTALVNLPRIPAINPQPVLTPTGRVLQWRTRLVPYLDHQGRPKTMLHKDQNLTVSVDLPQHRRKRMQRGRIDRVLAEVPELARDRLHGASGRAICMGWSCTVRPSLHLHPARPTGADALVVGLCWRRMGR
jgi:hypothetical protein